MGGDVGSIWRATRPAAIALASLVLSALLFGTLDSCEPFLIFFLILPLILLFLVWLLIFAGTAIRFLFGRKFAPAAMLMAVIITSLPTFRFIASFGDHVHLAMFLSEYRSQIREGQEPMFFWETGGLFNDPSRKAVVYELGPSAPALVLARSKKRMDEVRSIRPLFGGWYLVWGAY